MPLSEERVLFLQQLLREREGAARAAIRRESAQLIAEPYAELAGSGGTDRGEAATADVLVDVGNAVIGVELAALNEIDAAFRRMQEASYGACVDCGEDIAFERLVAHPAAERCLHCQSVRERTFATSPPPKL